MGIRFDGLADGKLYVEPHLDGAPDKIEIEITLPQGRVGARFERSDGAMNYSISAPDAYEVIFEGKGINFIRR